MSQHTPGLCKHYDRDGELFALRSDGLVCRKCNLFFSFSLIAKAPEMHRELERLANEMQAASSQGVSVTPAWLDRRITRARALLREIEEG